MGRKRGEDTGAEKIGSPYRSKDQSLGDLLTSWKKNAVERLRISFFGGGVSFVIALKKGEYKK